MRRNSICPLQNAPTALSFAAFKIAGAVPPARAASIAYARHGNSEKSGFANVNSRIAVRSSRPIGSGTRSGHVNAYWMGNFMFVGPRCARILPSVNSTRPCTMLCG